MSEEKDRNVGLYYVVDPQKFGESVLKTAGAKLSSARSENDNCPQTSLLVKVPGNALSEIEEVTSTVSKLSEFKV